MAPSVPRMPGSIGFPNSPQAPLPLSPEHFDEIAHLSEIYLPHTAEAVEFSENDLLSNLYALHRLSQSQQGKMSKEHAKRVANLVLGAQAISPKGNESQQYPFIPYSTQFQQKGKPPREEQPSYSDKRSQIYSNIIELQKILSNPSAYPSLGSSWSKDPKEAAFYYVKQLSSQMDGKAAQGLLKTIELQLNVGAPIAGIDPSAKYNASCLKILFLAEDLEHLSSQPKPDFGAMNSRILEIRGEMRHGSDQWQNIENSLFKAEVLGRLDEIEAGIKAKKVDKAAISELSSIVSSTYEGLARSYERTRNVSNAAYFASKYKIDHDVGFSEYESAVTKLVYGPSQESTWDSDKMGREIAKDPLYAKMSLQQMRQCAKDYFDSVVWFCQGMIDRGMDGHGYYNALMETAILKRDGEPGKKGMHGGVGNIKSKFDIVYLLSDFNKNNYEKALMKAETKQFFDDWSESKKTWLGKTMVRLEEYRGTIEVVGALAMSYAAPPIGMGLFALMGGREIAKGFMEDDFSRVLFGCAMIGGFAPARIAGKVFVPGQVVKGSSSIFINTSIAVNMVNTLVDASGTKFGFDEGLALATDIAFLGLAAKSHGLLKFAKSSEPPKLEQQKPQVEPKPAKAMSVFANDPLFKAEPAKRGQSLDEGLLRPFKPSEWKSEMEYLENNWPALSPESKKVIDSRLWEDFGKSMPEWMRKTFFDERNSLDEFALVASGQKKAAHGTGVDLPFSVRYSSSGKFTTSKYGDIHCVVKQNQIFISKEKSSVDALAKAWFKNSSYETGLALGYPETAIDAYSKGYHARKYFKDRLLYDMPVKYWAYNTFVPTIDAKSQTINETKKLDAWDQAIKDVLGPELAYFYSLKNKWSDLYAFKIRSETGEFDLKVSHYPTPKGTTVRNESPETQTPSPKDPKFFTKGPGLSFKGGWNNILFTGIPIPVGDGETPEKPKSNKEKTQKALEKKAADANPDLLKKKTDITFDDVQSAIEAKCGQLMPDAAAEVRGAFEAGIGSANLGKAEMKSLYKLIDESVPYNLEEPISSFFSFIKTQYYSSSQLGCVDKLVEKGGSPPDLAESINQLSNIVNSRGFGLSMGLPIAEKNLSALGEIISNSLSPDMLPGLLEMVHTCCTSAKGIAELDKIKGAFGAPLDITIVNDILNADYGLTLAYSSLLENRISSESKRFLSQLPEDIGNRSTSAILAMEKAMLSSDFPAETITAIEKLCAKSANGKGSELEDFFTIFNDISQNSPKGAAGKSAAAFASYIEAKGMGYLELISQSVKAGNSINWAKMSDESGKQTQSLSGGKGMPKAETQKSPDLVITLAGKGEVNVGPESAFFQGLEKSSQSLPKNGRYQDAVSDLNSFLERAGKYEEWAQGFDSFIDMSDRLAAVSNELKAAIESSRGKGADGKQLSNETPSGFFAYNLNHYLLNYLSGTLQMPMMEIVGEKEANGAIDPNGKNATNLKAAIEDARALLRLFESLDVSDPDGIRRFVFSFDHKAYLSESKAAWQNGGIPELTPKLQAELSAVKLDAAPSGELELHNMFLLPAREPICQLGTGELSLFVSEAAQYSNFYPNFTDPSSSTLSGFGESHAAWQKLKGNSGKGALQFIDYLNKNKLPHELAPRLPELESKVEGKPIYPATRYEDGSFSLYTTSGKQYNVRINEFSNEMTVELAK